MMPNYGIWSHQYLQIILLKNFKCTASGVMVFPDYFIKKFQVYNNDDNSRMLWVIRIQCDNAIQSPWHLNFQVCDNGDDDVMLLKNSVSSV